MCSRWWFPGCRLWPTNLQAKLIGLICRWGLQIILKETLEVPVHSSMPGTISLFTYYPNIISNDLTIHSQKGACLDDKLLLSFQSHMVSWRCPRDHREGYRVKHGLRRGGSGPSPDTIGSMLFTRLLLETSSEVQVLITNTNKNGNSLNTFKYAMTCSNG